MNKTIKILSIISVISSCLAVLLTVLNLTVFWDFLCFLFSNSKTLVDIGPIVPARSVLHIVGGVIVTITLFASIKPSKNIVIEILAIILLSIILPIFMRYIEITQNIIVGNVLSYNSLTALEVTKNILALPTGFANISYSLCLITSGMRIAEKIKYKN